ncbi:MAG TPA: NADP-dependent oxidoreductase [Candidatus Saccharimonadales bacterium]|nr:NADP-dependent oxidoreductase [Candidatus Saccharimonadales bacterium]
MKAARISETGSVDVITLLDIEAPDVKNGQVLIEVAASSINPVDMKIREGAFPVGPLPLTLGGDVAGVVLKVGSGVTGLKVGDKVYGQAAVVSGGSGAFAEIAAAPADHIAPMPDVSFEQAASLPLVGASAIQALNEHLNLQSGQKLFIHGGAGGIGSMAIQIAKNKGAYVATTATGEGIAFVRSLGADEVIDYKSQDFSTTLKEFDAVFDLVGGPDFEKALHILKPGGIGVSMVAEAADVAKTLGVTAIHQGTHVDTTKLTQLAAFVNSGVVTPQVFETFPLSQIKEAFTAFESGHVKGKIVIIVKSV